MLVGSSSPSHLRKHVLCKVFITYQAADRKQDPPVLVVTPEQELPVPALSDQTH